MILTFSGAYIERKPLELKYDKDKITKFSSEIFIALERGGKINL